MARLPQTDSSGYLRSAVILGMFKDIRSSFKRHEHNIVLICKLLCSADVSIDSQCLCAKSRLLNPVILGHGGQRILIWELCF